MYLAHLLHENGKLADAKKIIDGIIADDPLNVRALRFAATLADDGKVIGESSAGAYLDSAVEASAESALVYLDRGKRHWVNGRAKEAKSDIERAKALLREGSPLSNTVTNLYNSIEGDAK
jgi:hypothetical protein